ncbi:MAG: hypothetical protein HY516_00610 [Candidatus Aenigmarchaeota archaeon]|nr:hypothetical protein [Candidatus Aenigmarchaeota archaeon]
MVRAFKGQSDDALMVILMVVGLLLILGAAIMILVVMGKPAALKAIPMIGDALCEITKSLGANC